MFTNQQLRLFFVLFAFLFITGCASNDRKVINQYHLANSLFSVSYVVVDDKDNTYDEKESVNIPRDVNSLFFSVVVNNPKRIDYQIWSETIIENKQAVKKFCTSNIKENSSNPYRVECPLSKEKTLCIVSLRYEGQTLFELLPLEYQVQPEEMEEMGGDG